VPWAKWVVLGICHVQRGDSQFKYEAVPSRDGDARGCTQGGTRVERGGFPNGPFSVVCFSGSRNLTVG